MSDKRVLAAEIAGLIGEELRKEFPHRSDLCVLATKSGLDVCRYFGIEAKPTVVSVLAYNAIWKKHMHMPFDDPRWDEVMEQGGYSLAIDEHDYGAEEPGRYPGHLVLVLPDEQLLLDLSLRQFARPQYGLEFPDVGVFPIDADFMEQEIHVFTGKADSGTIVYRRRRSYRDFHAGPDWRLKSPFVGGVIRRLKER